MKKLSIILCLLLFTSTAPAADVQMLARETTVNALMNNGWQLHSTSNSDYVITYTLIRFGEVVTCKVDSKDRVQCFKP